LKTEVSLVSVVELVSEVLVRGLRDLALLIEKEENTSCLGLNQIDAILVVDILDLLELDALLDVELLLVLKDANVEELLQLFVAVVDAKLLKTVHLEVLETSDIEHTNEVLRAVERKALVDATHDPVEKLAVEGFRKGITTKVSILD